MLNSPLDFDENIQYHHFLKEAINTTLSCLDDLYHGKILDSTFVAQELEKKSSEYFSFINYFNSESNKITLSEVTSLKSLSLNNYEDIIKCCGSILGFIKEQITLEPISGGTGEAFWAKPEMKKNLSALEKCLNCFIEPVYLHLHVDELTKVYKLKNASRESLSIGLRNATVNNKMAHLKSFIFWLDGKISDPDQTSSSIKTALHWAGFKNHNAIYRILIKKKADRNKEDAKGKKPEYYKKEMERFLGGFTVLGRATKVSGCCFFNVPKDILLKLAKLTYPDFHTEDSIHKIADEHIQKFTS